MVLCRVARFPRTAQAMGVSLDEEVHTRVQRCPAERVGGPSRAATVIGTGPFLLTAPDGRR
ncbi:hypothetical protein GCM10010377_40180 [Streptomyces viridiviolaceus]|nr:hypothetical protein GCM10010377_40180 [Streptomyces viridiviolaceus]